VVAGGAVGAAEGVVGRVSAGVAGIAAGQGDDPQHVGAGDALPAAGAADEAVFPAWCRVGVGAGLRVLLQTGLGAGRRFVRCRLTAGALHGLLAGCAGFLTGARLPALAGLARGELMVAELAVAGPLIAGTASTSRANRPVAALARIETRRGAGFGGGALTTDGSEETAARLSRRRQPPDLRLLPGRRSTRLAPVKSARPTIAAVRVFHLPSHD
jgi:hypothetical protein